MAQRFDVSLGMVKKLLSTRRHQGDIAPAYHRCGRKALFTAAHRQQLRQALKRQADLTLDELRQELGLECSLPAIHYVLIKMGLSLKKKDAPGFRTRPQRHCASAPALASPPKGVGAPAPSLY